MASEQGATPEQHPATPEQKLHATRARLDVLAQKMVAEFGAEVTAHLLTELARRYADLFIAEVRGGWSDGPAAKA